MMRTAFLLAASFVPFAAVQAADKPAQKSNEPSPAVERMLLGAWEGGPCMGRLTFSADGTFERLHYTPGNNYVTGTWEWRWNALPPTLVLHCKKSDDPDYVGRKDEFKLVELNDTTIKYRYADDKSNYINQYTRPEKSEELELDAMQGTWIPLDYDEGGRNVPGAFDCKHIIKDDHVTVVVSGKTIAEGKVVLDPTKNPKRLQFQFASGQTDLIIYVRVGDYITYCGNRDGKTWPTEFVSGTPGGGEYLLAWKIER